MNHSVTCWRDLLRSLALIMNHPAEAPISPESGLGTVHTMIFWVESEHHQRKGRTSKLLSELSLTVHVIFECNKMA